MKWQILRHNGIAFPPPYDYRGLTVRIQGKPFKLSETQEEMLMAWAKKKDTPYVQDPVFQQNFLADLKPKLPPEYAGISLADIDFARLHAIAEREKTANLSDDEKKARSAARKAEREELKAKYGTATVDDHTVEVGAYLVEPPGILMGRGNHPLRGKWKRRVTAADVTLNLDEGAPVPPGTWKEIVHEHDSMWIASWWDDLSKKRKYIWLAETSHLRQERDQEKYLKADKLEKNLARVRVAIEKGMQFENTDARKSLERQARELSQTKQPLEAQWHEANKVHDTERLKKVDAEMARLKIDLEKFEKDRQRNQADELKHRQIATVCYLIDRLAMRVGDEKDEDEADTVGASTLRVEHIHIGKDRVAFDFLGKDSVRWEKALPINAQEQSLVRNLQDFMRGKQPSEQIFDRIDSTHVNRFLGAAMEGLTAKVFRTYHATTTVRDYLARHAQFSDEATMFEKEYVAKLANLDAAIQCNHKRTPPKNWEENLQKKAQLAETLRVRAAKLDLSKLHAQIAPREKTLAKLAAAQPNVENLQAQVQARAAALANARTALATLPKLDAQIQTRQATLDKLCAERKKVERAAQALLKKKQATFAAIEKQKPPKAKKALAKYNRRLRAARQAVAATKKASAARLKRLKTRFTNTRHVLATATAAKRDKTRSAHKRIAHAEAALKSAQDALTNGPRRYEKRLAKARAAFENARHAPEIAQKSYEERVEKAQRQYELARQTRDYNLGTSLKNYIDPRVYKAWSERVGWDWKRLYTKALQRKFAWVEQARRS